MNKGAMVSWLRWHYPKAFGIRKQLAKKRIAIVKKYLIPKEETAKAEKDAAYKNKLVKEYGAKWQKMFDATNRNIDELFQNVRAYRERTDLEQVRNDMLFCKIAYGFQPDEYMFYRLEGKNQQERQEYVSDVERYVYTYTMGDISDIQFFLDKTRTYQKFAAFYKRDAIVVRSDSDIAAFKAYLGKHPEFVCKKASASRGSGVKLIDSRTCGKTPEELLHSIVSGGRHLLEERVVQGEPMARLNASSVNTIRCITFRTKHGVVAPFAFLKVGRNGSFVDNGGAGGILVGVDIQTGRLNSDGYDEVNETYTCHPESQIVFKGYQLPEWDQMIATCKKMAEVIPTVGYVGWDMAYSNKGWVVIEGNMGQMIGPQIVMNRGIKAEIEQYRKDMDLYLEL